MYGLVLISNLTGNKYSVVNEATAKLRNIIEGGSIDGVILESNLCNVSPEIDGPCLAMLVDDVCVDEFSRFEHILSDITAPADVVNGIQFKKIVGTAVTNLGALKIWDTESVLAITMDDYVGNITHDLKYKPEVILFDGNCYPFVDRIVLTRETIETLINNPKLRTPTGIDDLIEQGAKGINAGMFASKLTNDGTLIIHSESTIFLAQWLKSNGVIINYQSPFISPMYKDENGIGNIVLYQKLLFNFGKADTPRLSPYTPACEALNIHNTESNYYLITPYNYNGAGCRPHVSLPILQFNIKFSSVTGMSTLLRACNV